MFVMDIPPGVFDPPAIVHEIKRKKRGSRSSRTQRGTARATHRVRVPVGMAVVVGMWLVLSNSGERCLVTYAWGDGTYDCEVY